MADNSNNTFDAIEQITSTHVLFNQHHARWLYLYNSYVGGDTYRKGNYLTKYQLESENEYNARLEATPLDNQCKGVVSVYNSFLFREDPERDFGGLENLPELQEFMEDADYEGRSLDNFMKEVSTWSAVFGHCWIIMSKPNINAQTKADEQLMKVRPYVNILTPLTVVDWEWERCANGRYELTYFKYIEEVNGDVRTYKTWTKEQIVTQIVDLKDQVIMLEEFEVNQLGMIPTVIAYNARDIMRGIGVSAINDIADAQRFIYNATSEVDQSIRLDSHPSLVKTPETMAGIGAGSIIHMPENLDGNLKPYILDFTGANIESIYNAIRHTIETIEKMANIGSIRATQAKTMSGVALETEFQLLNARLSEMADNLELAEEQMWRIFCMYQGQTFNMEIDYPGSFNMRDTGSEIAQLKQAADTNPVDPRVKQGIDMKILDWLDLDEDEIAALGMPNVMNPDQLPEPGELPED